MERFFELIKLVHQEAMNAYWANHCHCGGQFRPECSELPGCSSARQCHLQATIDDAVKEMEARDDSHRPLLRPPLVPRRWLHALLARVRALLVNGNR